MFNYVKEQQLVRKIQEIHDKIFSQHAKRYVFYLKMDKNAQGSVARGYYFLSGTIDKEIIYSYDKPELKFGDKLIVVNLEKKEFSDNTIIFKKNCFKNLPKHDAILIDCHFLYFRQMIQLLDEAIENYEMNIRKNVEITQLISLEYILARMEKGEVE